MRNMVSWLLVHLAIISRDDYVIMILLCCFDLSGRHIVPRSLWSPHVHSQHRKDNTWGPARAWRLIWIAHYSQASLLPPLEKGGWTADLFQKKLRSHSEGDTRLWIEAVRDLTELNWRSNFSVEIQIYRTHAPARRSLFELHNLSSTRIGRGTQASWNRSS